MGAKHNDFHTIAPLYQTVYWSATYDSSPEKSEGPGAPLTIVCSPHLHCVIIRPGNNAIAIRCECNGVDIGAMGVFF